MGLSIILIVVNSLPKPHDSDIYIYFSHSTVDNVRLLCYASLRIINMSGKEAQLCLMETLFTQP